MNKSKFLKKSLALLLSVMMVVAMIPLGASAAWNVSNTDDVVEITTTVGTIDKTSNTAGTLTLDWNETDPAPLSILFQNTVTSVAYKIDDAATDTTVDVTRGTAVTISVPVDAKTLTFVPSKGETKGATYTITVNKPAASSDTTLKEATIGTGDTAIKGVISGRTIVFTVPWGTTGDQTVTVTPNHPNPDDTLTATIAVGGTGSVNVSAQDGSTSVRYDITINEATALTALGVAGTAGTVKKDGDGNDIPNTYTVSLPIGTDMAEKMPVTFTIADLKSATWNGDSITSGKSVTVNASNTLILTSKTNTTKTYTVEVGVTPNNKAEVESFTLSDGTYTAEGKVSGETLTAELPNSANLATITAVFTPSEGATVTAAEGSVTSADGKFTVSSLDFSTEGKTVRITVTAADGNKSFYYSLSATKADTRNPSNTVDAMKMTIGSGDEAVDYQGTISGTTITFANIPYGTTAAQIAAATFTGAYPSGSTVSPNPVSAAGYTDNDLKTDVTFTVTSETGRVATYTIKFVKAAAKTGKSLSGVSFANAATADDVKADKTYAATVSGKKMTVTFPYSAQNKKADYASLVPTFTVSEGAKLYGASGTEIKSGFFSKEDAEADETGATTEGAPKTAPLTLTNLANEYVFTVADETAVFEMAAKGKTLSQIANDDDLSKHITEITVEVKYAEPQTGNTLSGVTDEKGEVTGSVSGNTLTITVPGSYVAGAVNGNAAVDFSVEWNASAMATLNNDALTAATVLNVVADGTDADGNTVYALKVKNGAKITSIVVENEAKNNTRTYNVAVKVNPVQTGALVTSAKANDINATVNNTNWTITATVPATTDLTAVKLAFTGSTMAKVEVYNAAGTALQPVVKDDKNADIADTYDVSDAEHPLQIKVTAEDQRSINFYTLVVTTETINFTDVKEGTWYYEYVYAAANAGIVKGTTPTTFAPSNNIKRGDFALMVVRMLGAEEEAAKYTTTPFSDVSATSGAKGAIAYCAEKGIIGGVGNNRFAPNSYITREQAAKIVAIALGRTGSTPTKFADDAKIAGWAKQYVDACSTAGLIDGVGNNNFNPKGTLTRAQAAKILVLALNQK